MKRSENLLPTPLLGQATLRGNEYSWPVSLIPEVIEAARVAGLVNLGGQLQLRFPDRSTCEAYWIEVDTMSAVPLGQSWQEKVTWTAQEALKQFKALQSRFDFQVEGQKACPEHCAKLVSDGSNPDSVLNLL